MNSLTSAKNSLFGSAWMSGGFSSMQKQLANGLNAANFIINPGAVAKLSLDAVLSPPGTDGDVGNALEFILKTLGLEALVKMMKLKVADGVDTPPDAINKVFNVLADGLPPFFWDVRVMDKAQGAKPGEEEDLVFTDSNHDDYNARRYNMGPLVYFPLVYDMNKIKTSKNLGINGKVISLPDYDEKSNAIRAIGKARIFFRQPSDHWLNRYKVVVTSSLLLPYWQARNESLSYVDKWSLSTISK